MTVRSAALAVVLGSVLAVAPVSSQAARRVALEPPPEWIAHPWQGDGSVQTVLVQVVDAQSMWRQLGAELRWIRRFEPTAPDSGPAFGHADRSFAWFEAAFRTSSAASTPESGFVELPIPPDPCWLVARCGERMGATWVSGHTRDSGSIVVRVEALARLDVSCVSTDGTPLADLDMGVRQTGSWSVWRARTDGSGRATMRYPRRWAEADTSPWVQPLGLGYGQSAQDVAPGGARHEFVLDAPATIELVPDALNGLRITSDWEVSTRVIRDERDIRAFWIGPGGVPIRVHPVAPGCTTDLLLSGLPGLRRSRIVADPLPAGAVHSKDVACYSGAPRLRFRILDSIGRPVVSTRVRARHREAPWDRSVMCGVGEPQLDSDNAWSTTMMYASVPRVPVDPSGWVTTDENGWAELEIADDWTHSGRLGILQLSAGEWGIAEFGAQVLVPRAGKEWVTDLGTVRLGPRGVIAAGTVLDGLGEPAAGVVVQIRARRPARVSQYQASSAVELLESVRLFGNEVTTDSRGAFAFEGFLTEDPVQVVAGHPLFEDWFDRKSPRETACSEVVPRGTRNLVMRLRPAQAPGGR